MAKTIAVLGATGTQGGGVVKILLKSGDWKVRAITRNTGSDKAKALASSGAEVVAANTDDLDSLVKTFEGVHAIFAVTNFWEHMFTGNDAQASGLLEQKQAMNIAVAASKTTTLEHFIWSTLPSATKISNGKLKVPHLDYKEEIDSRIIAELPALAKKTTFLWLGWYPSNLAWYPMLKAIPVPGSESYIFVAPSPVDAYLPVAGEVGNNTGVFVKAILANPAKSHGRTAFVKTETLTQGEIVKVWEGVTGKKAQFIPATVEAYTALWGPPGKELADQYVWGAAYPNWEAGKDMVSVDDLGIKKGDLIDLKQNLEMLKDYLV